MSRVIVYVDGFNLYHAIHALGDNSLKWLDLWSLSEKIIAPNQHIAAVKYFSAYATWRPGAYSRHRSYVEALKTVGVTVIMGRFKEKHVRCGARCGQLFRTHEEKETDVNIGVHLMADAFRNRFDTAFIISADTDIAAAVRLVRREIPEKQIVLAAPPGRYSRAREMGHLFAVAKGKIRNSRLPDNFIDSSGRARSKPPQY